MKGLTTKLIALSAMIVVIGAVLFPRPVFADFNQNRIIDDALFDNVNSMNAAQIDAFLNSFPNSCISTNSGFAAALPIGYSPLTGYKYGEYATAGQGIAAAAQAYSLNPQVLLSTLQKEQSLVVGGVNFCNNGDENKYAAAVGYGCPDSGTVHTYSNVSLYRRNGNVVSSVGATCVNTAIKAGFSQQVIRAAWLLKFGQQRSLGNITWAVIKDGWDNSDDPESCYSGPMTQGTFQVCPSSAKSYYDGYRTIDNSAVHMDSGAAAALYWYTPHFHGNQMFSDFYTQWFGSPILDCTPNETVMPQVVTLYNPRTYQHFYTAYRCEANAVGFKLKYTYEGAAFNTTSSSIPGSVPVWRLYNQQTGDSMWVTAQNEIDYLATNTGYRLQGIAFYSSPPDAAKLIVWRLYNPKTYQHVWTSSQDVINIITQKGGFKVEGVGFFSQ